MCVVDTCIEFKRYELWYVVSMLGYSPLASYFIVFGTSREYVEVIDVGLVVSSNCHMVENRAMYNEI